MAGRATPSKLPDYKLSLQLYKTFNYWIPTRDWIELNFNNIQTTRQGCFMTNKTNRLKIGMNILSNRLWYLNGKIDLNWLNMSFQTYKIKCKKTFPVI